MRTILLSVLVGGAVAIALYPALPGLIHSPRCPTVEAGGVVVRTFCISYDPALGRYETPPAGVPADYDVLRPGQYPNERAVAAAVVVGVAAVLATIIRWIQRFGGRRHRRGDQLA